MARRSFSKNQVDAYSALDCTKDCSHQEHARLILSVVNLGNLRLLQHCKTLCGNYIRIRDRLGRSALHVAASKGHTKLVQWLISKKVTNVNLCDLESGWSALHRSVFYGQLGVSALLVKSGGDLKLKDNDWSTPLSILNEDRECFKQRLSVCAVNVYTWGSNSNVTLGHDHSRNYPEKLELSQDHTISQVVLCKFHSVLLTENGEVLTCGHGLGGRLGHDSEQSLVVPCRVKALDQSVCISIAAARNHTVILTKSGSVYTCGLNDAHQLGQGSNPSTAPSSCLVPKPVKALKNKHVIAIGAGRYHTAFCTSGEVYTMGKNLGQLGYEKSYDTQISPRAVAGVNLDPSDSITHLSASDAATACLTKKCRIFVCTGFTVKTIRWGFLEKSSCLQFSVCSSLSDFDHLRKVESEPTKVLMLDSSQDVWYWEPTVKGSVPNHLPGLARLKVVQFYLGRNLSVVTKQGEVYSGPASLSNKPLQLSRVPNIQNARAVFTDFKSSNFAFTQQVYSSPFQPELSPCSLLTDLNALLEEACLPGSVSDLEIESGGQLFTAHRFIVGTVSSELSSLIKQTRTAHEEETKMISIKCDNSSVFEAFLYYVYGSHVRLLPPASQPHPSQLHPSHSSQPHSSHSQPSHSTQLQPSQSHPPQLNPNHYSQPHSSQLHPSHPSQLHLTPNGPLGSGSSSGLSGPTSSTTSLDEEMTPDTSFASVDENDLTAVYDQFATSKHVVDQFEEIETPVHLGRSTPKKKSNSLYHGVVTKMSDGEPQRTLQLVNPRADLKALHQLATTFGVGNLKKSLDDLLDSQTKRHLTKPLVLVSPRPSLQYNCLPQFSDLVLLSEDGDSLRCHRCVLVARSDYFRSMLLMGWRESSNSVKSLSLPVSTPVLKAVLEFIYTGNSPAVTGSTSLEWVVSVLVVADQLLLTRLKDICEKTLATSLSLRNVSEMLDLAETYSAYQLKKSCLQFISANAACLLEARLLDNLDPCLLDELSSTYQELAPFITKRVIKFPEPDLHSLPETYFLEDATHEGSKVNDIESPDQSFSTTHNEHYQSPSVAQEVTPRGATNSSSTRKKRRRKTSQSESKKNTSSNTSALLHSPTNTPTCQSPVDITPKGGLHHTESLLASKENITPLSRQATPASRQTTPQGGDSSAPVVGRSTQGSSGWTEKQSRSTKKSNGGKARKRLVDTFATSPSTDVFVNEENRGMNGHDSHSVDKIVCGDRESTRVGGVASRVSSKGPWAKASPSNGVSTKSSLREIMAKEEEILQRNKQQARQKSPPPEPPHPSSSGIPITRARRQSSSQESPVQSPLAHSPSVNPWKSSNSDLGTSPTVSLRDLMMEAEATQRREKQQQRQARMARTNSLTHLEDRKAPHQPVKVPHQPVKVPHQPVKVPHQQVSFASIIRSQEIEQDKSRLRAQKPLRLIQIEEKAISELEELYSAKDNPDEFITVKQLSAGSNPISKSAQHVTIRQSSQDSPWGRDSFH